MKKSYKRAIPVLLSAFMMLSSCSAPADTNNNDTPQTEQTQQAEQNIQSAQTAAPSRYSEPQEMRDIPSSQLIKEMKIGWGLGNTLDANSGTGLSSETSWGSPKITQEIIDTVKARGFNVIRIPVTWFNHMDEDDNIDPEWMRRVTEVVDYVIDGQTYAILNIHHENWNYTFASNKERAVETEIKVWEQIADNFKYYDEHLIFEGQNEPRMVGTDKEWVEGDPDAYDVINAVNAAFVSTVRSSGGNNPKRHLMIPSYAAKFSDNALQNLDIPQDDKVIVSVHAYIPYNFALNKNGTARFDPEKNGSIGEIKSMTESLQKNLLDKNIPVIIGETGAMNKSNDEARILWAKYFISKTQEIGVPCVLWDNQAFTSGETFGLLDRRTLSWRYPELMDAYMEAFGL